MPERCSWTRPWRHAAERHPWAVLCVLPVLALAIFCSTAPAHALLTPDSPGYLYFTAGRPAGYPAFLWLVHAATAGYSAVRPAQAALYCAAAAWLGAAAHKFSASLAAALALQALLLAYPAPIHLADEIMADSLSATITILFAAQTLRVAVAPSPANCVAAAMLAGLGVLVRPDNIALFPAALLLCTCAGALGWRALAIATATLCAALAITPLAQIALRGTPASDHRLGRELMQKAIFLPPSENPPGGQCDTAFIDGLSAPLIDYWRAAPPQFQDVLRLRISNLLRYDVIIPALIARHGLETVSGAGPILMCYTLRKLSAAPRATVAATAHEYRNLILNYTFVGASWQRGYMAFLHAHPPPLPRRLELPPETLNLRQRAAADVGEPIAQPQTADDFAPPRVRNALAVRALNAIQIAGCATSWIFLLLLAAAMRNRHVATSRHIVAAAALSVALQLHLLAIAAVEIAEPRYIFPLWPLFLVPGFMAATMVSGWKRQLHAG